MWGRSICYSLNLGQNPGKHPSKTKFFRIWASRLGSPLSGGNYARNHVIVGYFTVYFGIKSGVLVENADNAGN